MSKKIAAAATVHPSTALPAPAVVADIPKIVFEIAYTIQQRGHNPEVREVIVAAEKMSDAVAYVESQGSAVQRACAVLNGAQFVNL